MKLCVDFPAKHFISDIPQQLLGWCSTTDGNLDNLSLSFDGQPLTVSWHERKDVESAWPGVRAKGWECWLRAPHKTHNNMTRRGKLSVLSDGVEIAAQTLLYSRTMFEDPKRITPLFWLHIPKTAGTSIREIVDSVFPKDSILRIYGDHLGIDIPEAKSLPQRFIDTKEIIFGHSSFGLHKIFKIESPCYATVLRDPIELLASYIAFTKDIDQRFLDNPLTRYLSGVGYEVNFGEIDHRHLAMAQLNIAKHFAHVGFSHDTKGTAKWLAEVTDQNVLRVPNSNEGTTGKDYMLSDRIRIKLDYELYTWCRLTNPTLGNLERLYYSPENLKPNQAPLMKLDPAAFRLTA